MFVSMFNEIEYWIKDNQQTCLANATGVTKFAKQFKLSHLYFGGLGEEKSVVSHVLEQTKRSTGLHRQEHDTEV